MSTFPNISLAIKSFGFMHVQGKIEETLNTFAVQQGAAAENFFKKSFENQGFTNKALEKWESRKINRLYLKRSIQTNKKRSVFVLTNEAKRANHLILVKRGHLRRSVKNFVTGLTIKVSSNLPYSQIQNEGGYAGRGRKVRIPARPFIAESEKLLDQVEKDFFSTMDNLF